MTRPTRCLAGGVWSTECRRHEPETPCSSAPASELARVPGAEPRRALDAWWWLVVAVVGSLCWLLVILRPDPYLRILIFVRDGIAVTVLVTVVSFVLNPGASG